MNYTLHQLQVFLKITKTGSVTKAAEELHLTQPAVSIQLRNFQDQFDIPLTEVIGRKIFITEFGKEIARSAESILAEAEGIRYKTMAHQGMLTGRLHISAVSTGQYVMPFFLSGFIGRHEGLELVIDVTNKSRVVESLEQNQVDFALVSILPEHIQVEKVELFPNKLFLVGNSEMLKKTRRASKSMLSGMPLIYREPGSGTRYMMEKFLSRNEIRPVRKMELATNEAVKQALLAGLGYSIMPLIGIKNEIIRKELHIIPVKGLPMLTHWYLIWLKGKQLSVPAKAYLEHLKKEKEGIIRKYFEWYANY